jgi:hypothetical protein
VPLPKGFDFGIAASPATPQPRNREAVYKNLTLTLLRSAKHQSEALHLIQDLAKIDIEKNKIISNNQLNVKVV